jgi:hypothetical protein
MRFVKNSYVIVTYGKVINQQQNAAFCGGFTVLQSKECHEIG